MNLVIRAHTLKNETLSQAITGHFDERGGTIGRSDTNTLTLPDPERHISRLQAEVWFSNGGFSIRNVGSANAITINGRPVNPGEGAALAHGDEIVVGGYGMRATVTAAVEPATQAPVDARTVIKASASEAKTSPRIPTAAAAPAATATPRDAANPFADLFGTAATPVAPDPFADLLGGHTASPAQPSAPAYQPARTPTAAPSAAPARLPDDFDPFADLAPAPANAPSAAMDSFMRGSNPPAPSALPPDLGLGELLGQPASQAGGSIDTMFDLKGSPATGADPLASFLSAPKPGQNPQAENTDPLAMFGAGAAPTPAPSIPADFNHTPEIKAAYVPPAVQAPRAAPPAATVIAPRATPEDRHLPPTVPGVKVSRQAFDSGHAPLDALPPKSTPAAPAAPAPGTEALWAAFCEGAGVSIKLPQGLTPELMKVMGQVMQRSVDGTIKLMAVRAAAKQELKADVTVIQARNNNPLKFSPDAGIAIEQLLQPPMRGFMMGPAAVSDAMNDLLSHAIGTMAGMRAALTGVLERFEPAQLEGKLAGNSVLDSVLPMNRRAKLWELYLQHYKRIRDDAQDDFHDLFGKAFIEAYEEQLDRLDEARHPI